MAQLDIYKELVKDYNITPDMELNDEFKLMFVASQIEEIKKVLWREIVDYIISCNMAESKDEAVAMAGSTKKQEKRTMIKQFTTALRSYNELVAELEK